MNLLNKLFGKQKPGTNPQLGVNTIWGVPKGLTAGEYTVVFDVNSEVVVKVNGKDFVLLQNDISSPWEAVAVQKPEPPACACRDNKEQQAI